MTRELLDLTPRSEAALAAALDTPLFKLLLELLDQPSPLTQPHCPQALSGALDGQWGGFEALLHRHRVTKRAITSLQKVGIEIPARLKEKTVAASVRAMEQASEAHKIYQALEQCGIRSMVLKGTVLSQRLYGDPALRESKDIDLLIDESDLEPAIRQITNELAYAAPTSPPFESSRLPLWLDLNKDIKLVSPSGLQIELHHRLVAFPKLLPSIGLDQATSSTQVGPWTFPQFESPDLFAYLCTHGTTSRWHRLTWLADIRTMLGQASANEILAWYDHARKAGVARPFLTALALCHRLWAYQPPHDLILAANSDLKVRKIAEKSVDMMLDKDYMPSIAIGPGYIGNALMLADNRDFRLAVLKHLFIDPGQVGSIPLPMRLRYLYVPLRIVQWVKRKIGKLLC